MTAGLGAVLKRRHAEVDEDRDAAAGATRDTSPSPPSASPEDSSSPQPLAGSSIGVRLLLKAGYRGSGGLGKQEQGVAAPISDSLQLSTHGLGFQAQVKRQRHEFTPAPHVTIEIEPLFLHTHEAPPSELPSSYCQLAPHDDELLTCPLYGSLALQHRLQECKSVFDSIDGRTFLAARARCNPFELIKGEMFQNRAALKMAEVDRISSRLFTSPSACPTSLLYFGDICAGPGGFTEYILTHSKYRAKGFGFTLRGSLDFRVDKFNSNAPAHSFKAYYGEDGTGDITRNENIQHFAREVWRECDGLHVCMADGGFDVHGEENKQELRSLQLILCECAMALAVLRVGGAFMCKMFDVFLPFSVSLLWLMLRCFDQVAIVKPNQSRPANSERYFIGRGKKADTDAVLSYLYAVNSHINALKRRPSTFPNKSDRPLHPVADTPPAPTDEVQMAVVSLVPEEVIAGDEEFMRYIRESNDGIAERQIDALLRLLRYVEDPNLPSDDQEAIRLQCLAYWEITDQREQEKRREQRRLRLVREEQDGYSRAEGEPLEPSADPDQRIGYLHFDPSFLYFHCSRYPHQGFFSLAGAERLHVDLIEQLRSSRPLEPWPTAKEKDDYRKRVHTAPSVRQLHSFCDHSWSCIVVPTGGVHSFILASAFGVFVLDERDLVMPLPSSYRVALPADTALECILYPDFLIIVDAWSLPSPPSLFPTHRTLWMHRSPLTQRLRQAHLLLEAMRMVGEDSRVRVALVRAWGDLAGVKEGEDDVLVVREEAHRPTCMRWWDAADRRVMPLQAVHELMAGVLQEREREQQRDLEKKASKAPDPSLSLPHPLVAASVEK